MATKLKNLKIRKVDFVDEGANPDAHIVLYKHRNGGEWDPGRGRGKEGFWKRLASIIREAVELAPDDTDSAAEDVQKGDAASFHEKVNEVKNRKIADEIWDLCYALQSSLCSVLYDDGMDSAGAAAAMKESLGEFQAVMGEAVANWAEGSEAGIVRKDDGIPETELEVMKAASKRLEETIQKAETVSMEEIGKKDGMEGEEKEMNIDKSRLTPAELAFLESIEKRYGETGAGGTEIAPSVPAQQAAELPVTVPVQQAQDQLFAKSIQPATAPAYQAPVEPVIDDIYKGLHPAVKAELEELKKFRENAEERELAEIAKKYAIIGKKEEELVPMLKGLKGAGGTAYSDMIAVLDQAVDTVEKSGMFSEIGKAGGRGAAGSSAEAKISEIAKGYIEKDPTLNYDQAVTKAWEAHPEIMEEYEKEAGF